MGRGESTIIKIGVVMIRKTLLFPLWLLSLAIRLFSRLIGMVLSIGLGTLKLFINRLFSGFFGALIGFFFGKRHIGIKVFAKRRKLSC